jgi:hypothetical protein
MTQPEITQRRSAAFADLSEWFDLEPTDFRILAVPEGVELVARLHGTKARAAALRIINRHFPGVPVNFVP